MSNKDTIRCVYVCVCQKKRTRSVSMDDVRQPSAAAIISVSVRKLRGSAAVRARDGVRTHAS